MIIETLTDNRNRTGSDIRAIFSKNGGSMAEPGAVAWQFERKGVILVPKKRSGADDQRGRHHAGGAGGGRRGRRRQR